MSRCVHRKLMLTVRDLCQDLVGARGCWHRFEYREFTEC